VSPHGHLQEASANSGTVARPPPACPHFLGGVTRRGVSSPVPECTAAASTSDVSATPVLGTPVAMKSLARALILVAAAAMPLVPAIPQATAAPTWAPAATAPIHPGVQTVTAGAQCTANFVFTSGTTVYIGQAAHCSGTGGSTETDGCTSGSLPVGTPVDVGGVATGTMVYNSWLTMQSLGETDANTCAYNDLALIRLSPADAAKVNPSIP